MASRWLAERCGWAALSWPFNCCLQDAAKTSWRKSPLAALGIALQGDRMVQLLAVATLAASSAFWFEEVFLACGSSLGDKFQPASTPIIWFRLRHLRSTAASCCLHPTWPWFGLPATTRAVAFLTSGGG